MGYADEQAKFNTMGARADATIADLQRKLTTAQATIADLQRKLTAAQATIADTFSNNR